MAARWLGLPPGHVAGPSASRRSPGSPLPPDELSALPRAGWADEYLSAIGYGPDGTTWRRLTSGGNLGAPAKAAGIGEGWPPRGLRHSFVSLLSASGVPVEEIARLVGRSSTRTTEVVYRKELCPVLVKDAEEMDQVFG